MQSNKQMKYTSLFLIVLAGLSLLSSCSGDTENRTAGEYLSAYLKDNKKVMAFGKIDLDQILEKADYKNIPKMNVLINEEITQYKNAIEMAQGVHFAVEGPLDLGGNPSQVVALVRVKNADSLVNKINSQGLMMQESGGLQFVQDGEVSIGVSENLAVFMVRPGKYDSKKSLKEIIKKCEGDLSSGKVEQIIKQKGDITFGMSLENTYLTSNTSMRKLDAAKKKELEALVSDSYLKGSIAFNKGEAVFETEHLFSDELLSRMSLLEDPEAKVKSKLGSGKARIGLAVNADVKKMENFMMDFSPDYQREVRNFNFLSMFSSGKSDNSLTKLWSGIFGLVAIGDLKSGGGLVPEVNFHVGLGENGKEMSKNLLGTVTNTESKNGEMVFNGITFNINDTEISGSSVINPTSGKLEIPAFADNFGKKGITGFVDLTGLDLKSMGLEDGAKSLYAVQYVVFEVTNKSSKMIVRGKNPNLNILKQIADVYIEDIKEQLN